MAISVVISLNIILKSFLIIESHSPSYDYKFGGVTKKMSYKIWLNFQSQACKMKIEQPSE